MIERSDAKCEGRPLRLGVMPLPAFFDQPEKAARTPAPADPSPRAEMPPTPTEAELRTFEGGPGAAPSDDEGEPYESGPPIEEEAGLPLESGAPLAPGEPGELGAPEEPGGATA